MYTKQEFIDRILHYRMEGAAVFNLALRYSIAWPALRPLEVKFSGKTYIEGFQTYETVSVGDDSNEATIGSIGLIGSGIRLAIYSAVCGPKNRTPLK